MNTPAISEAARLRYALQLAAKTLKEAKHKLEEDGTRYTWLDTPIDVADEALALDSAHPAPKEGETNVVLLARQVAKLATEAHGNYQLVCDCAHATFEPVISQLELRLSEAKREVEALKRAQDLTAQELQSARIELMPLRSHLKTANELLVTEPAAPSSSTSGLPASCLNEGSSSAPSLQSVAEGVGVVADLAAKASAKILLNEPDEHNIDNWQAFARIYDVVFAEITRHFAPLLTERDERIERLEKELDGMEAQRDNQVERKRVGREKLHEIIAALRTRCEELERDKERLDWLEYRIVKVHECMASETPKLFEHVPAGYGLSDDSYLRAAVDAARKEGQQAHEKGEGA